MKLMVGLIEDHFFAYDISTFEKFKSAYLEHIGEFHMYCKEPEVSKEDIEKIPKAYQYAAKNDWFNYEERLKDKKEWEDAVTKLTTTQTEKEFTKLAYEYGDIFDFYLNSRGHCEFVEIKERVGNE